MQPHAIGLLDRNIYDSDQCNLDNPFHSMVAQSPVLLRIKTTKKSPLARGSFSLAGNLSAQAAATHEVPDPRQDPSY